MARGDGQAAVTLRIPGAVAGPPGDIDVRFGGDTPGAAARVLLVDDDARLRAVVRELLEDDGITIVGEAGSAGAALDLLATPVGVPPLVALVDVRMPGLLNGIELTRVLTRTAPGVKVVVFTGFAEPGIEQAAREAGAVGVLHKGVPARQLVTAIRRAFAGVAVGR